MSDDRKTILIIDDDPVIIMSIEKALKGEYNIISTDSAETGLDMISKQDTQIDLVYVDLNMPGDMDGFTFIAELHLMGVAKQIPIVVISGSDNKDNIYKALYFGAFDFINKPFVPKILQLKTKRYFEFIKPLEKRGSVSEN